MDPVIKKGGLKWLLGHVRESESSYTNAYVNLKRLNWKHLNFFGLELPGIRQQLLFQLFGTHIRQGGGLYARLGLFFDLFTVDNNCE